MSAVAYYSKGIRLMRCTISVPLPSTYHATLMHRNFLTAASSFYDDNDRTCLASKQTWLLGVAAVLIGFSTADANSCDKKWRIAHCTGESKSIDSTEDTDSNGPHNDFGAKPVENDPYAALPEVDEETTCEICNTFRKGPCRKYWRKTERCWKEGDADSCLPYSTPFINCSMYYRNLYVLVMLDNFQEYVTVMEEDAKSVAVREFSDESTDNNTVPCAVVDWNPWNEFNKDFGPSFSQAIPSPPSDEQPHGKLPLWKRLPTDTEPILVPCNVKIPSLFTSSRDDNKRMQLRVAYVTDQDGFVVGKYFKPSKSSSDDEASNNDSNDSSDSPEQSTGTVSDSDKSTSPKADDSSGNDTGCMGDGEAPAEISCIFLPGETKSIVVTAYYADESQSDFLDESEEEAAVYKKEYDLYKMLS